MIIIENEIKNICKKNWKIYSATLELTTICNWRCRHCYNPTHSDNGLSTNNWIDILHQLRQMGVLNLTLTGGEIFTRTDILDIIHECRKLCFNTYLYTNISLLNENIIKEISNLYISGIGCTIYSLEESIHDNITMQTGSLKAALKNIEFIKKYDIPLEIKVGLTNMNYKCHWSMKEYCNVNGFKYVPYFDIFCKTNGDIAPKNMRMSYEQMKEVLMDIDKIKGFQPVKHKDCDLACDMLKTGVHIDCRGNVYPCSKFFVKLGNVLEEPLKKIYVGNNILQKISNIKWKDLKQCNICLYSEYCERCSGIAYLEDKNMYASSSLACEIAKVRKDLYENR